MSFASRSALSRIAAKTPLALALAGWLGAVQAQSLQELYEVARGYDATYLGARSAAESAQLKAEQAKALWRPSVGLQAFAGLTRADGSSTTTSGATNPATVVETDSEVSTSNVQVTLSAQQTLYNGSHSATISQAERAIELAQAQARSAEQDLIVRLSQAYFDVLAAGDTLATVQASKKAIAEQLASAKRNFEVGTANITDTREAEARFDLVTAQELAADNDLRVKQLALEQLVGRAGLKPVPLAKPVKLPALQPAEVSDWVSQADANNPSVRQARLAMDVAKLETEKAQAGHLPTVTLGASYTRSFPGGSTDVNYPTYSTSTKSGNGSSAAIGVTLNLPLFAGYAIENRVKETVKLEDKARYDLEGARNAVAQGTRSAFFGVQSGQAQVKALEAAEASSKLALDAIQLGYKVGVRVNLDVLNAQTQLFQTQRDLAKARYDVIVAGLKLRQVSGQLNPDDLGGVNALLAR